MAVKIPIVAIGGIGWTNGAEALEAGRSRTAGLIAVSALAGSGDVAGAEELLAQIEGRNPETDQLFWEWTAPERRADIAIAEGNPELALELLEGTRPYELRRLFPIDLRARAYLAAGKGAEAVAEFERVIAARTINPAHPIHATAILGKARGHALAGDTDAARAAYNDFLTLWRHADPDIPLLQQAQAELDSL